MMRNALNARFIFTDNTQRTLLGINLGADYAAEHQEGIDGICHAFGVGKGNYGLAPRTVTKKNKNLQLREVNLNEQTKGVLLLYDVPNRLYGQFPPQLLNQLGFKVEQLQRVGLSTSWNENSFGVLVPSQYGNYLKEIFDSFNRGDIVIDIGNPCLFSKEGPVLLIKSRIPKQCQEAIKQIDLDEIHLEKALKHSRIESILKKVGINYIDLKPRWKDPTKKDIVVWLNPCDQRNINSGWFTLQDFMALTKGYGPILKR